MTFGNSLRLRVIILEAQRSPLPGRRLPRLDQGQEPLPAAVISTPFKRPGGDVHVGTIGIRSGNPTETDQWGWRCGFYPGSNPGECKSGTAASFDAARSAFEAAWPAMTNPGPSLRKYIIGAAHQYQLVKQI
jgi:hypothetical protein